jgi:hypothetical protein
LAQFGHRADACKGLLVNHFVRRYCVARRLQKTSVQIDEPTCR